MDHGDGDGDGAGDGVDVEASSCQGGEVMMMAMISPLSGAPEQQDLTPFGEDQELRRRHGLR